MGGREGKREVETEGGRKEGVTYHGHKINKKKIAYL